MKSKNFENVICFVNGSVGDFLMFLYFSKIVRKISPETRITILTPRSAEFFGELASKYEIAVRECGRNSWSGFIGCFRLGRFIFSRNIIVTPLTSGNIPLATKLLAKLMVLRKESQLWGSDRVSTLNRLVFDRSYNFPRGLLYPEMMVSLVNQMDFGGSVDGSEFPARLEFPQDFSVLSNYGLQIGKYVVIHPCGSSRKRSFDRGEIVAIVQEVLTKNSGLKAVITGSVGDAKYLESELSGQDIFGSERLVNLVGKVRPSELTAIVSSAKFYVGVDTGISHLAAFIGQRGIVTSHEASTLAWMPYYNQGFRVLYSLSGCPHDVSEGLEHLRSCYDEEDRYFLKAPIASLIRSVKEEVEG